MSIALSNGHTADIKMVEQLLERLKEKLYADRGYISQELKLKLKDQYIDLITYHRKTCSWFNYQKKMNITRPLS